MKSIKLKAKQMSCRLQFGMSAKKEKKEKNKLGRDRFRRNGLYSQMNVWEGG